MVRGAAAEDVRAAWYLYGRWALGETDTREGGVILGCSSVGRQGDGHSSTVHSAISA